MAANDGRHGTRRSMILQPVDRSAIFPCRGLRFNSLFD
jgi:hypothetical protein